jgi:hypothetical protein
MVDGGEWTYDEELLSALLCRCDIFESRRARSRWRFNSRCSAVSIPLGGLAVIDLDAVGGDKLTSDPYEPRWWPSKLAFSMTGHVKDDRPAMLNVGSY